MTSDLLLKAGYFEYYIMRFLTSFKSFISPLLIPMWHRKQVAILLQPDGDGSPDSLPSLCWLGRVCVFTAILGWEFRFNIRFLLIPLPSWERGEYFITALHVVSIDIVVGWGESWFSSTRHLSLPVQVVVQSSNVVHIDSMGDRGSSLSASSPFYSH